MLILVTGLEGFTGRYVKLELESEGHRVVGLVSDLTDQQGVADEVARVQPDAVVHLAGVAFVGHGDANAFYQVNLIGTRNLLSALADFVPDIQSVLLVSSANIYGNQSEGVLEESALANPANDYAVSKLAMEKMAALWLGQLPLFVVRPFNYTGVGQHENFLIPKVVRHFKLRKPVIELGNLDVWREFGDVRVVASIYRQLLHRCPVGQTFNVCTGETYSLREIIALCEEITGHSININVNPEFVRENEVKTLAGNNGLLKKEIGEWESPTLRETILWMLESE